MPSGSIVTEIEIAAAPERVWTELTAFESYESWNPFILKLVAPKLAAGERIEVTAQPPGHSKATFRPQLLAAEPNRELRWRGSLPIPGLFVGTHYFVIEPTPAGSKLTHGEDFTGLLVPFLKGMLRLTEQGFKAMNEKLKERAEAAK